MTDKPKSENYPDQCPDCGLIGNWKNDCTRKCEKCGNKPKREPLARTFPMMEGPSIPWDLAEEIYKVYSFRYGTSQSLERLAERGGFGWREVGEMWTGRRSRDFIQSSIKPNAWADEIEKRAAEERDKAVREESERWIKMLKIDNGDVGYWWCPNCKDPVDGNQVTFEEAHERCGSNVVWIDPKEIASSLMPPEGKGVPNEYQKCPVCDGMGLVSRPPYVAGDQTTWVGTSCGPWPCQCCGGAKVILRPEPSEGKGE